jgi:hypothetical protein
MPELFLLPFYAKRYPLVLLPGFRGFPGGWLNLPKRIVFSPALSLHTSCCLLYSNPVVIHLWSYLENLHFYKNNLTIIFILKTDMSFWGAPCTWVSHTYVLFP